MASLMDQAEAVDFEDLAITVIYDNYEFAPDLKTDHGFACLVEGPDRTILFDTGGQGSILMENLSGLAVDPEGVDVVFISHDHYDHNGGLVAFLGENPNVEIHVPGSALPRYRRLSEVYGCALVGVQEPRVIGKNALTTGEMESPVRNEHALLVVTDRGIVLITGCAHPGIRHIVERAQKLTGSAVYLAVGGFHLMSRGEEEVRRVISGLQDLGIRYAAPSHCTGTAAIRLFEEIYGSGWIRSGAGRVIDGGAFPGLPAGKAE